MLITTGIEVGQRQVYVMINDGTATTIIVNDHGLPGEETLFPLQPEPPLNVSGPFLMTGYVKPQTLSPIVPNK